MGCEGCPLFPNLNAVLSDLVQFVCLQGADPVRAGDLVAQAVKGLSLTSIHQMREVICAGIAGKLGWNGAQRRLMERRISSQVHCYAAMLHLRWAGNRSKPDKKVKPGFAPVFEEVKHFPGRMAAAAKWKPLQDTKRPDKPWLDGLPRLIFVSDMGDALSSSVPFGYLKQEIVDVVGTAEGARHLWLWLTKRPGPMARFARWLKERDIAWPDNLVAMTSVLDARMAKSAIKCLQRVPAPVRGLSVEPLLGPVKLDLEGIDWVIVGGESGHHARPFHLEWARALRDQCRAQGVAFFMKQLGARPFEDGLELKLHNRHGGDWEEWPEDLRIREMPAAFREYRPSGVQGRD